MAAPTIATIANVAGVTVLQEAAPAIVTPQTVGADPLPYTGSSSSTLVLVALGMMLSGLVLIFGGNSARWMRRRSASTGTGHSME